MPSAKKCQRLPMPQLPLEVFFLNSYTSFISGHFLFDTSLVIPDDMLHQRECGKQEQWDLKPHPLSVPHNRAPGLCQEA